MVVSRETEGSLKDLGERLRGERLRRDESQKLFAFRIGASIPTLARMEDGDPRVAIGYWAAALDVLGRERDLDMLLPPPEDLFLKYEQQQDTRKRASRKRP